MDPFSQASVPLRVEGNRELKVKERVRLYIYRERERESGRERERVFYKL
jgi:hypothetical protein